MNPGSEQQQMIVFSRQVRCEPDHAMTQSVHRSGGGPLLTNARIVVTHYGGPDAPMVIEEEGLEPKPGQVRVRVLAASVFLPDVRRARGHPSRRPGHFFLISLPAHAGMADIPHPFFFATSRRPGL